MSSNEPPWEPPLAGTSAEHLIGSLERLRATFWWKCGGLDRAGLRTQVGASSLTLGGLLKHLALVEDNTFVTKLSGQRLGAPWNLGDWDVPDWEFKSAGDDSPEWLYRTWRDAVSRSRVTLQRALDSGGLDQLVHISDSHGRHASLRRLLHDLLEEYGRHVGHADLLREAVDGVTGEDPPTTMVWE